MTFRKAAEISGSALIALNALPALAITAAASTTRPRLNDPAARAWLLTWGAFTAPLLLWTLISGLYLDGVLLLLQGLLGAVAGIWLRPSRAAARLGLLIGLAVLAAACVAAGLLSSRSLIAYDGAAVTTRIGTSGFYQRLTGSSGAGPEARRSWLTADAEGLELTGRIRSVPRADEVIDSSTADITRSASILLTLDWPARSTSAQQRFRPGTSWARFSIPLADPIDAEFVILRLDAEPGGRFDVAGLRLSSVGGTTRAPPSTRQALHLQDPVTLAHVGVAIATALTLAASGVGGAAIVAIVALAGGVIGWATGTRAVFFSLALLLLVPLSRRFSRRSLLSVMLIVALLVVAAFMVQRERASALVAAVPRTDVWATAITAFRTYPLTGLRGAGLEFAEYAATSGLERPVMHAHNFWLDFASRYGIFGALAGLGLGTGLLVIAVRRGGLLGVLTLLPILVLNVVDSTLLQGQVLLATTLALNLLPEVRMGPRSGPAALEASNLCSSSAAGVSLRGRQSSVFPGDNR